MQKLGFVVKSKNSKLETDPRSDAESDGEASHLPKPWLAPRAKAGGLQHCSRAWHSWSCGYDT